MKVLLIIEQCNPEWASVPLVGYNFYSEIARLVNVTLVTHERNRHAIEKVRGKNQVIYIEESSWIKRYYPIVNRLTSGKNINWPLQHALAYPVHAQFDQRVFKLFKDRVIKGEFDVVHAITPILPRYSYKLTGACKHTPFLLGPVNGGIPFPKGFEKTAKKEYAHFNFLKYFSKLIPGYRKTYKNADRILAGSSYTLDNIKNTFTISNRRISLFFENGITGDFFSSKKKAWNTKNTLKLLYVGRLVPYKGASILVEAMGRLIKKSGSIFSLTIVGDGPERKSLEKRANSLGISESVHFTGWIEQKETLGYYKQSDLFCFPSIREFGGAVVLEAMAGGLPCIVINYGGIGEYVTEETGFKIDPVSSEHIENELVSKIELLFNNSRLRKNMSKSAIKRAEEFRWDTKAQNILQIYNELIDIKK